MLLCACSPASVIQPLSWLYFCCIHQAADAKCDASIRTAQEERDAAVRERDAAQQERDEVSRELVTVRRDRDGATRARDSLQHELDNAKAHVQTLMVRVQQLEEQEAKSQEVRPYRLCLQQCVPL